MHRLWATCIEQPFFLLKAPVTSVFHCQLLLLLSKERISAAVRTAVSQIPQFFRFRGGNTCFLFVWFGDHILLCSGITRGGVWETIWGARDRTGNGYVPNRQAPSWLSYSSGSLQKEVLGPGSSSCRLFVCMCVCEGWSLWTLPLCDRQFYQATSGEG